MYIHIYVYTCICVHMYTCICTYPYTLIDINVQAYAYSLKHMYISEILKALRHSVKPDLPKKKDKIIHNSIITHTHPY